MHGDSKRKWFSCRLGSLFVMALVIGTTLGSVFIITGDAIF